MKTIYAITDIETTGSFPSGNSITEIAICLFDGLEVLDEFHSLINPQVPIPPYVRALTGITDNMLRNAPTFEDIAEELRDFFGNHIFVAHNVNFDYSFIRAEFQAVGMDWNPGRMCTVRMSRKAFPELSNHGLSKLCAALGIINHSPHRALGDARATVEVFSRAMKIISEPDLKKLFARGSSERFLPNHINQEEYDRLPQRPGVYYFLDNKGKPIYIGKATNIQKRVKSHFTAPAQTEKAQGFIREIHHLEFQETGNELIALLLEDREIRRHWPKYNKAQKRRPDKFAVLSYYDNRGYLRLAVNQANSLVRPVMSFSTASGARKWLSKFVVDNQLDLRLFGLQAMNDPAELPSADEHNLATEEAIRKFQQDLPTVVFFSRGRKPGETAFVLVEKGKLLGFGFAPDDVPVQEVEQLENHLETLAPTETNDAIIRRYLEDPKNIRVMRRTSTNKMVQE